MLWYPLEAPRLGASNEYSHHIFCGEIRKLYADTTFYLELCRITRRKHIWDWQMLFLIAEWSYFLSGLNSGVVLFSSGLNSGVVLFSSGLNIESLLYCCLSEQTLFFQSGPTVKKGDKK